MKNIPFTMPGDNYPELSPVRHSLMIYLIAVEKLNVCAAPVLTIFVQCSQYQNSSAEVIFAIRLSHFLVV